MPTNCASARAFLFLMFFILVTGMCFAQHGPGFLQINVTVSPMQGGQSQQLTVQRFLFRARNRVFRAPLTAASVRWYSSDPTVVSVNTGTGAATAGIGGTATIMAVSGPFVGRATITVTPTATNPQYTLLLTDQGDPAPIMPVISDALEPSEPNLTQTFNVSVPNNQCTHLVNVVDVATQVPLNSHIREIEASFNGQALPLVDPWTQGAGYRPFMLEDCHNFGPVKIPFNKPLFSVAGVPPGTGTLTVRAYDAGHSLLASKSISGLSVARGPAPVASSQIAAMAHPRIWLTPQRLTMMRGRNRTTDPMAKRFWDSSIGVGRFIAEYKINQDPYSNAFQNAVYNPEGYIPGLALCYQIDLNSDPTQAQQCATAAHTMVMRITTEYLNGTRNFGRDTDYDMRDAFAFVALAYDWMHDQFTSNELQQMYSMMTQWLDEYHNQPVGGYSEYWAQNNYYPENTQALALMAIGTMGESPDADRMLARLRDKLNNDLPVANQRICGGDWPEGFNYGGGSMISHLMAYNTLKDIGEDWSVDYDFAQPLARSMTYQMSPDFTDLRPYGGYSGAMPHKTEPHLLAILSTLTSDGALASRLFNNAGANPNNDFQIGVESKTFYEMIFGDMTKTADVSAMPLSYLASGTGRFFSKSSLTDANAYQVITENISYFMDHYGYADGDVRLYHGATCLVCPSTYRGNFNGEEGTPAFSTYMVNGAEQQNNRNNQILFTKEATTYSAIGMRFESSFAPNRFDEDMFRGSLMPLDYMIREVVHVRPGILVVRDLHHQRAATNTLVGTFHLGPTAAPQNPSPGQYTVGNVSVSSFSSAALNFTFTVDRDQSNAAVGQAMHMSVSKTTAPVEMVTVISDSGITGLSYSGGVLKLSNNQCVTFANGDVNVAACP